MTVKKPYKIIILGPAASGKGTQTEMLSEKLNIPTISAGQLLREEIKKETKIGIEIKDKMKTGELMPNSLTNKLMWERLQKADCKNGFILDGFPRTRIQAKFLSQELGSKQEINKVFFVNVSDKEVEHRLSGRRTCAKCGQVYHIEFNPSKKENVCNECEGELTQRADDTPEGIRERLRIFHTETIEVIEYYKEKGLLIEINGEQSIEKVRDEIFKNF
ncbi:adenylate kinase family protein [Patescibacteria group bacterium]